MTRRAARFTQAELDRAIKGAKKAGFLRDDCNG